MRWRDIRFEKPTVADANEDGAVLMLCRNGEIGTYGFGNTYKTIAWMPLPELPAFDPIPDPPEGWKFVVEGDAFDFRYQVWDASINQYRPRNYPHLPLTPGNTYIVPIDPPAPPEPQYRPYSAAELKETIGKLVDGVSGYRAMITGACGDSVYCQGQRVPADQLLKNHAWTDGGKCGVKVQPFEP